MGARAGRRLTVLVGALAATAALSGAVQPFDQRMLLDALSLAHTRESGALEQFHQGYQLTPADPRVSRLEVITEFRRAVLLAQAEARRGNFVLSPTGLARLLTPYAGRIAFVAEVRISPLATFVGPPEYHIDLTAGGRELTVLDETRDPVYPLGTPPGSGLMAVIVETSFPADDVRQPGCCELTLTEPDGKPFMRQTIAVAGLR